MAWENAGPGQRENIIQAISRNYPAFRRTPERCLVDLLGLSFYPGGKLVRLSTRDVPGSLLWFVYMPQETVALNSGPAAIDHCNAVAPLSFNDISVFDYIKFRYYFGSDTRLFEARVKRSAVGYTGKVWVFEKENFFEIDLNISPRGTLTLSSRMSPGNVEKRSSAS